ncbi:MAG TPA: ABC transporter ATP-binding protein [Firmicutes bacterium]|nr:ABC transporter ATP-binding protein [Bacillota bacterium]
MVGICKTFPGVVANDHIDLEVNEGEILALLGENGAGKSTLMNILSGIYRPDAGSLFIRGERVELNSPADAARRGIAMIHQHFTLVPQLRAVENAVAGLPRLPLTADGALRQAREQLLALGEKYGLAVDPDAFVWQMSVGEKQRLEILKALKRGAAVLVLDEPTAVLTPQEAAQLFAVLRSLAAEGHTIVLITHKLEEVMAVSQRVVVLRRGRVAGEVQTAHTNARELAQMMVGRDVVFRVAKCPCVPGEAILAVEQLTVLGDKGLPAVRDLSFGVWAGEIVGIAGVDGNGQAELAEAITGLRRVQSGHVRFLGEDITNSSPRHILSLGLAHIPAERQEMGSVPSFPLKHNLILHDYFRPPFARGFLVQRQAVEEFARRLIGEFDVRAPSCDFPAALLSGGNLQKLILARELWQQPKLLVAVQPTRGLDVGAIEYVHGKLLEQRARGAAVILVSTELEEILTLSDRILVMHEGRITGEVQADKEGDDGDLRERLGLMMAGCVAGRGNG